MCAKPKIFTRWVSTSWVFFWWSPNTGTRHVDAPQPGCCHTRTRRRCSGDDKSSLFDSIWLVKMSLGKCRWAKCDMLQLSLENVHFPHCNCCPIRLFHGSSNWYFKISAWNCAFFQQITARQITANRWWLKAAIPAIRFACPPHEFVSKFSWAYHESSQLGEFIFGRFYYGHAPSMKSCQRIQSQSFTHPAFSARKQDVHFFNIFVIDIYLQHYKWNRPSVTVPIPLKRIHKRRYWGYIDGLDFLPRIFL